MFFKKIKPNCPRCRASVNVVDRREYYRCAFCGKIMPKKKKAQRTLKEILVKNFRRREE